MARQLSLFGDVEAEVLPRRSARPRWPDGCSPLDLSEDTELARRLPPGLRFGTSSWTFPGWAGLVYPGDPSERDLVERGLGVLAAHPLIGCVGIDRGYYAPFSLAVARSYAAQLPADFPCVTKAWSKLTNLVDPRTRGRNEAYLDLELFRRELERPLLEGLGERALLVLEHAPVGRRELPSAREFAGRLDAFLGGLPRDLRCAVELRNPELFTPRYLGVLARHGCAHVLNFWERMPPLRVQMAVPAVLDVAPFVVTRLLIPPGERYADRVRAFEPFDRLLDPQPEMRADVLELIRVCERSRKQLLVIVNNKAEGSSPLTIRELARQLPLPVGLAADG